MCVLFVCVRLFDRGHLPTFKQHRINSAAVCFMAKLNSQYDVGFNG